MKPSRRPEVRRARADAIAFKNGESVRVDFDSSGADAALDGLLEAALRAVRPAAQAGAQVLYEEAKVRVPVSAETHIFYGRNSKKTGVTYTFQPGNLYRAIYQAFSKDMSSEFGDGYRKATYHIGWNHKDAPYGFMVEFGTSRAAAHPFLAPAYDGKVADALNAAKREFAVRMKAQVPGLQ